MVTEARHLDRDCVKHRAGEESERAEPGQLVTSAAVKLRERCGNRR